MTSARDAQERKKPREARGAASEPVPSIARERISKPRNPPQSPALSARRIEAATLVFEGHSMRAVARRLGVDESTVRDWSKQDEWKAHVAELESAAKSTAMDRAVRSLRSAVEPAAALLSEIVADDDQRGADRIRAAVAILDRIGVGPHNFAHVDSPDEMSFEELEKALDDLVLQEPERVARLMRADSSFCAVVLRILDVDALARFLRAHERERGELLAKLDTGQIQPQ